MDLCPAELGQHGHHPGAHEAGCDAQVVVHRADGPQQGRLHVLGEEGVHSRGVARGGEVQGVHGAAGHGRGAGVPDDGEDLAGARVGIHYQVAPVQSGRVAGAAQVAPVGLGLRVSIAAELGDGAGEQVAPDQGRPGQDAPDLPRDGHAVADQNEHLGVAGVRVVWEVPAGFWVRVK